MAKIQLTPLKELFGEDQTGETMLPLTLLTEFKNHPFHVTDDEEMDLLVDSICQNGVLTPIVVRKSKYEEGTYEILAGHRRKRACELAGFSEIPAVVKELTDEEATILMIDSNMYREHLSYSEKAFAYRMRNEAMKKQGKRTDLLEDLDDERSNTADQLGAEFSESARTVFRYIRLTYLTKELLQLVDEGSLSFMAGVSLSYLKNEEQFNVYQCYERNGCLPDVSQAKLLKKLSASGTIFYADIEALFVHNESDHSNKRKQKKVILKSDKLSEFFSEDTTNEEIEDIIIQLLKQWREQL